MIRSGNQFREHVRVDIASRQNDDDVLAARVDTAGQKCGEHDVARYLARVNAMKLEFTRLAAAE